MDSLLIIYRDSKSRGLVKERKLWTHVSPEGRKLLEGKAKGQKELERFSWRIESAFTLAWALNLVDTLYPPTSETSDEQIEAFQNKMLALGVELGSCLDDLTLRAKREIFEENIFNELANPTSAICG